MPTLQLPPDASLAQLQHYVHQLEAHHDWLNLSVVDNGFLMTEEVGELHAALRHHQRALQRGDADAAAATKQEVAHELVELKYDPPLIEKALRKIGLYS